MSNGVPDDRPSGKKEGFTADEVYHLVAEVQVSIEGVRGSLDGMQKALEAAVQRSHTSDRNFDARLKAVEAIIEATQSKAHEDAQKLTAAIDRAYRAVEGLDKARRETDDARLELRETTQHLNHLASILEKLRVPQSVPHSGS